MKQCIWPPILSCNSFQEHPQITGMRLPDCINYRSVQFYVSLQDDAGAFLREQCTLFIHLFFLLCMH